MNKRTQKTVYNIPSGMPFARAIATKLLEDHADRPEDLNKIRILLPTRRACRVFKEKFLEISEGKPLILPQLQPVGDIDEEDLSLSIAASENPDMFLDIPPGISSLERQLLLARLIEARPDFKQGFSHALGLAEALGHFMDQIHTENLQFSALHKLVPEVFSKHWQITIDFLELIGYSWPKILAERGEIDQADRRNRLILALAAHWEKSPSKKPVIAAGSTGSIPAVAKLLSVVAAMPSGQVILPGLDQNIDQESWDVMDETHPQFGFRHLFEYMGLNRRDVQEWPYYTDQLVCKKRRLLSGILMKPAETSVHWTGLDKDKETVLGFKEALNDLSVLTCANAQEEADVIALMMRGILEEEERTATLITPDRTLARRVKATCKRWNINIDDSAGESLGQTQAGLFLKHLLEACINQMSPTALLSLLKHPGCLIGKKSAVHHEAVQILEKEALRGPKPAAGLAGIRERLVQDSKAQALIDRIETACHALRTKEEGRHSFADLIESHLEAAENLARTPNAPGKSTLWRHEDGEAAAKFFFELSEYASLMPDMTLENYADIIEQLFKGIVVRPAYGTHPRLMILGQLEARLIDADLVILGGLNEASWPSDPAHDPWMSRPMRRDFGLPSHERSIGLAAHDFVQGLCSTRVIITRARRNEGTQTVPSRWLQRMETVLEAAGLGNWNNKESPYIHWARALDFHQEQQSCERPAPAPSVEKRPRELSATRIETWLKDPYSIYARYILKLKKLDPIEQPPDAAMRGTLLHNVLDRFVQAHPDDIPENAMSILNDLAHEQIEKRHDSEETWAFWWPGFEKTMTAYLDHEKTWRRNAKPQLVEKRGQITIETTGAPFTLSARADRIDRTVDGLAVIDYKSSGSGLTKKGMENGTLPQLPVEALILHQGGFAALPDARVCSLNYWVLSGGRTPFEITATDKNIEALIERTHEALKTLIETFDDPKTPYFSVPRPDKAPRFNDYEHLARIKEWSILDDSQEGSKAA